MNAACRSGVFVRLLAPAVRSDRSQFIVCHLTNDSRARSPAPSTDSCGSQGLESSTVFPSLPKNTSFPSTSQYDGWKAERWYKQMSCMQNKKGKWRKMRNQYRAVLGLVYEAHEPREEEQCAVRWLAESPRTGRE